MAQATVSTAEPAPAAAPATPEVDDHAEFFGADEGGEETPPAVPPPVAPPPAKPAAPAPAAAAPEAPPEAEPEPDGQRRPAGELTWKNYRQRERENAELRQRLATFEEQQRLQAERVAQALGVQQRPQDVPGQTRPFTQQELAQLREEDPLAYNQVVAEMAYAAAMQNGQQAAEYRQRAELEHQINTFKAATPTYTQAMEFLQAKEEAALEQLGLPRVDTPHQVDPRGTCCVGHALQVRAGMAVQAAQQQGRNVAEVLYEVATKVYGWQDPSAAAPAPAAAPPPNPQQRVAESKARTAAAMGSVGTIPSSPGTMGRDTPTPEELESASEADMDKWDQEMPGWDQRIADRGL